MNPHYILDENGNPVPEPDLLTWAKWFGDLEKTRVASDMIGQTGGEQIHVSTIFLGIDHGFGTSDPVLWETMIFGGYHDQYQERYTSREDAVVGHAAAVLLATGSTP